MIRYRTLICSFLLFGILNFNSYIFSMKKYGKLGLTMTALASSSYALDKYDKREIMDISTPSKSISIKKLLKTQREQGIHNSFAKNNYFNSSSDNYDQYNTNVKNWVYKHCLVLSNAAEKLTDLIITTSYQEQEASENKAICFVHGTQKGASILFRTILDEVMSNQNIKHFVKLRNTENIPYDSADQFFTTELLKYYKSSGGIKISVPTGSTITLYHAEHITEKNLHILLEAFGGPPFDKLYNVRRNLLSANFCLCSNYSWIFDGYKEASLDYISDHCSVLSYFMNLIYSTYCLAFCPWVIGTIITKLAKDPQNIKELPYMLSEEIKSNGLDEDELFKEIFEYHKVGHLYERYKKELDQFSLQGNAAIVQISIPEELVNKYAYLSIPLGIMQKLENITPSEAMQSQYVKNYQARILLKPELTDYELASKNNVSMRFYMYIKPEDLHNMTARMYKIAQEISKEINKEINKNL